jgi:hypothetical protein
MNLAHVSHGRPPAAPDYGHVEYTPQEEETFGFSGMHDPPWHVP